MQAAWLAGQGAVTLAGAGQSPAPGPEALWVKEFRGYAEPWVTSALSAFGCTGIVAVSGVGPRWRNDALSKNVRAMTYEQIAVRWPLLPMPKCLKIEGEWLYRLMPKHGRHSR